MVHRGDFVVIGIAVGLTIGIFVASLVFFGIQWYKKCSHLRRCATENSTSTLPIHSNGLASSIDSSSVCSDTTDSVSVKGLDDLAKNSQLSWWRNRSKDRFGSASGIPRYSHKDIQKATQNFTTTLGHGAFGSVYKATMATGGVVAVKVLASDSQQGEREFQTEVSLLGRLHHRNLVNLVGYCVDKGQRMLIYEFMTNGSLASLLYGPEERVLSWDERLQIALDISHGIEYLHDGAVPPIIHRDLKSANILLDRSMRAKVADFGLSKEQTYDGCKSSLKGTYGYMDPAYISTSQFTTKSDIFSFGVILFELIVAIPPHQNLMDYINLAAMSPDGVDDILDKRLVGESNLVVEARSLALIAQKCLHKTPRKRPSIGEVSQEIFKIKQKRLAKEVSMSFAGEDISRMVSRIGLQQAELSKMAAKNMPITG
ncbi:hypothetical protein RHGRI_028643 [Rhododendron griersonianum]|uniref:non-specific serine/threonine protein kinase n=1 Tax=Rhododendron griersonianum TaxID=479676 RepID=A0AAV6IJY4_9ERIC|nr:hypothetical protein RHGRI_028643 [Rhododendron griersonianum]KAG5527762.1 hypothetical protein RHGRI_028643 [Rhododendron griersonianum]